MKRYFHILLTVILLCSGCQYKLKPNEEEALQHPIQVQRYDRLQSRYLTTGDFSALQQMNTGYPMETRTLIEDILKLGEVNDPEINSKFLNFYQDTLLQTIIADAEAQYADMSDIDRQLSKSFSRLESFLPGMDRPTFYAQIGALDQSIVVGDKRIGISLDKYLGKDYPLYFRYYTGNQRHSMVRSFIVPDCLTFYLLSLYPLKNHESRSQLERDLHMGKMMWTANRALGQSFFVTKYVTAIEKYMRKHPKTTVKQLLDSEDYTQFGMV